MSRRPNFGFLPARQFRAAGCEGKPTFDSYSLAAEVAKRGRRHKDDDRSPYRCKWCRKWHIGTRIKRWKTRSGS